MLSVNVCLLKHLAFECRVQKADEMKNKKNIKIIRITTITETTMAAVKADKTMCGAQV